MHLKSFLCLAASVSTLLVSALPTSGAKAELIERGSTVDITAPVYPRDVWSCAGFGYPNGQQRSIFTYVTGTSNQDWAAMDACFVNQYKVVVRVKVHRGTAGTSAIRGQYFVHGKGVNEPGTTAAISGSVKESSSAFRTYEKPFGDDKRILTLRLKMCVGGTTNCKEATIDNPKIV